MIRSMTGYGRGECSLYNRKFMAEIKSVNHRYNDLTIKLPRVMNSFEDKIRKKLSSEISRGKTDVYIGFDTFSRDDVRISLNTALADAYVDELRRIKDRYELSSELDVRMIAQFPDIIVVDKAVTDERILSEMWEALEAAVAEAMTQFVAMRRTEGDSLRRSILEKKEIIHNLLDKVKTRAPAVAEEYAVKMKTRIAEAINDPAIDESRLYTEIAIFADKSCIDEELTRLDSHLEQLGGILDEPDSVGRKLDFLVQEINREINTIGSKSNDLEISRIVVDLKSEAEKIREQVQNIE